MKQYLDPTYGVHLMREPYKWVAEIVVQLSIIFTVFFSLLVLAPVEFDNYIYYLWLTNTLIMYTPNLLHYFNSKV